MKFKGIVLQTLAMEKFWITTATKFWITKAASQQLLKNVQISRFGIMKMVQGFLHLMTTFLCLTFWICLSQVKALHIDILSKISELQLNNCE